MDRPDPIRIIHVGTPRSRLGTVRDVAIILVCAALLVGTLADLVLGSRPPPPRETAWVVGSVSM